MGNNGEAYKVGMRMRENENERGTNQVRTRLELAGVVSEHVLTLLVHQKSLSVILSSHYAQQISNRTRADTLSV